MYGTPATFEFVTEEAIPPAISDPSVEKVTMGSEHYMDTRQRLIDLTAENNRLLNRNAALEGLNRLLHEQSELQGIRYRTLRDLVQRAAAL